MFKNSAIAVFWRDLTFTERVGDDEEKEFSIRFKFKRLSADELEQRLSVGNREPLRDFLSDVVVGWADCVGEDEKPLPFTPDNLKALLRVSGMAVSIFNLYQREIVELRAKN